MRLTLSGVALAAVACGSCAGATSPGGVASLASVEADLARLRSDLGGLSAESELAVGSRSGASDPGIGSKVQVAVDLVHCRHLKQIEAIDGRDSEAYRAYLQQVYDAQRRMKPNFKIIHLLENIRGFFTGKKDAARLTEEGSELENPCEHATDRRAAKKASATAASGYTVKTSGSKLDIEGQWGVSPRTGLPYTSQRDRKVAIGQYKIRFEHAEDAADRELWGGYLCELNMCPEGFSPEEDEKTITETIKGWYDKFKAGIAGAKLRSESRSARLDRMAESSKKTQDRHGWFGAEEHDAMRQSGMSY